MSSKPVPLGQAQNDEIMLAQFTEMHNDWRYSDGRVEGAIRLYISTYAFLATVVVGITALYPQIDNPNLFLWTSVVLAPLLFALGFFTARRACNSTINRERRLFAIGLAKRYFQDRYPGVSGYLPVYVLTPEPLDTTDDSTKYHDEFEQLTVSFPDGIVIFIYLVNSALSGIFAFSILRPFYAVSPIDGHIANIGDTYALIIGCFATALYSFSVQLDSYKNQKRPYLKRKK